MLESVVVVLDSSEFCRNGDYIPTRMEAMRDAANLVCGVKIQMNPENSVGIVSCGGALGPKVLCSCTQDMAQLLSACSKLQIGSGVSDFAKALQVSALALKHRRNKNGGQRVVAFVCSPIVEDEAKLVKLAKSLKKNNVAVDVIVIGELEANESKLRAFTDAVDKNGNSHLIAIPPGVLPSDVLMTSPIVVGGDGVGGEGVGGEGGGGGGGGPVGNIFAEYGGVDPSLDPELAMVLRASMEEERARMAAASAASAPPAGNATETVQAVSTTPVSPPQVSSTTEETSMAVDEDDEEEMLRRALLMSINENAAEQQQTQTQTSTATTTTASVEEGREVDEDDEEARQLEMALAMSQEEDATIHTPNAPVMATSTTTPTGASDAQLFMDPSFVNELLEGLDGVDLNDPSIQALLASMKEDTSSENAKKQKKDSDKQ